MQWYEEWNLLYSKNQRYISEFYLENDKIKLFIVIFINEEILFKYWMIKLSIQFNRFNSNNYTFIYTFSKKNTSH